MWDIEEITLFLMLMSEMTTIVLRFDGNSRIISLSFLQ